MMKGVFILFAFLLGLASSIFYLALHITGPGSFPPALTAKEEAELITGRTHQIRAHMASIGHPLLGEGKYQKSNDKKLGFDKQALYSYSLKFDFTTDAGILNYLNGKRFTVDDVWFATELFGEGYKQLFK